jgi:geranylgeranyl diphosphate synthase, type I
MTSSNETTAAGPLERSQDVARRGVDAVLVDWLGTAREQSGDEEWRYGIDLVQAFVLGPGKRTRPTLCHLGWRSGGGGESAGIIRVAAALEMFHAFALIHDDVMDESDTRRARPTVHVSLAQRHRQLGWHGQPERFGRNAAILLGDICLSWADELFHSSMLPREQVQPALHLFHRMRSEVLLGQYLDIRGEARIASVAECFQILRLKSARYTVERPLQIGAALAGAGPAILDGLSGYGIALGEAFQLRDDVLGVFGNDAVTGKSAMTDLRDGKSTVLIALTRQAASAAQSAVIDRRYGDPRLDTAGAAALRQIIVETGSLRRVEEMIDQRTEDAVGALEAGFIADDVRAALIELARRLCRRTS